jgi:hypothetical protein
MQQRCPSYNSIASSKIRSGHVSDCCDADDRHWHAHQCRLSLWFHKEQNFSERMRNVFVDFAEMVGQQHKATVQSWNGTWGWLEVDGVKDARLFAHYRNVCANEGEWRGLIVGQQVRVEIAVPHKEGLGFQAINIEIISNGAREGEQRLTGVVTDYSDDRHFGWLNHQMGRCFFHRNNCREGSRIQSIPPGCAVTFLLRPDPKHAGKKQAVDVAFVDDVESAE